MRLPWWDMPDNADSIALIEAFVKAGKPVAAVCHAPAALVPSFRTPCYNCAFPIELNDVISRLSLRIRC